MPRDTEYFRQRLERDHPEIAARVAAGEITVHKAAVKAGICKPQAGRVIVSGNEVSTAQRILRQHGQAYADKLARELLAASALIQASVDKLANDALNK